jgi:hypothetical protein
VFPVSRSAPKSGNRFSGQADRREMSSTLIQVDWVDVLPCHHRIRCTRESRFILFRPHVRAAVCSRTGTRSFGSRSQLRCSSPLVARLCCRRGQEVSRHSFPVSLKLSSRTVWTESPSRDPGTIAKRSPKDTQCATSANHKRRWTLGTRPRVTTGMMFFLPAVTHTRHARA